MRIPTIIGLAGPAGCGKDTVANLLATHFHFTTLAFADRLRFEVCQAFSVSLSTLTHRPTKEEAIPELALERCLDNNFTSAMLRTVFKTFEGSVEEFMEQPRSPRQIMQWWGTEYKRSQLPNYWTQILVQRVNHQQLLYQLRHVITDVRFENEAQAVRNTGGVVWQVKRPGIEATGTHTSDVDGSQFAPAAIINNNQDIRHLQGVVVGAWLMLETGMSAQEVCDMGRAHTELANTQWHVSNKALQVQA